MGDIMATLMLLFLAIIFILYGVETVKDFIDKQRKGINERRESAESERKWAAKEAAEERRMKDPVYRAQKEKEAEESSKRLKERQRKMARERITATGEYSYTTSLTHAQVIERCLEDRFPFSPWLLKEYRDGSLLGTTAKERERRALAKKVKEAVWERDNGICVECGSRENLQFDHIIPHSRGGSDTLENLQILCTRCNLSKGNRSVG